MANSKPDQIISASPSVIKGRWHKRYTGTIAGNNVVLNLISFSGNNADGISLNGSYHYTRKSDIIFLTLTNAFSDSLFFNEYFVHYTVEGEEEKPSDKWQIKYADKVLKGTWISADGKKRYSILLNENYEDGYKFDINSFEDSSVQKLNNVSATANYNLTSVMSSPTMSSGDAVFFNNLVKNIIIENDSVTSLKQAFTYSSQEFFRSHKESIVDDELGVMNNWEENISILPIYNANGIIILQSSLYSYTGGAHGMYGSSFTCMDAWNKTIFELEDIIKVDSVQLSQMLEHKARAAFKLSAREPLEERMLVEEIPATANFYFSDVGITFWYNPYAIASYADGEVSLFLSYKELKSLLKEDFKNRLNLKL